MERDYHWQHTPNPRAEKRVTLSISTSPTNISPKREPHLMNGDKDFSIKLFSISDLSSKIAYESNGICRTKLSAEERRTEVSRKRISISRKEGEIRSRARLPNYSESDVKNAAAELHKSEMRRASAEAEVIKIKGNLGATFSAIASICAEVEAKVFPLTSISIAALYQNDILSRSSSVLTRLAGNENAQRLAINLARKRNAEIGDRMRKANEILSIPLCRIGSYEIMASDAERSLEESEGLLQHVELDSEQSTLETERLEEINIRRKKVVSERLKHRRGLSFRKNFEHIPELEAYNTGKYHRSVVNCEDFTRKLYEIDQRISSLTLHAEDEHNKEAGGYKEDPETDFLEGRIIKLVAENKERELLRLKILKLENSNRLLDLKLFLTSLKKQRFVPNIPAIHPVRIFIDKTKLLAQRRQLLESMQSECEKRQASIASLSMRVAMLSNDAEAARRRLSIVDADLKE